MRRADLIWHYNATQNTLADVTNVLGLGYNSFGGMQVTLNHGDILYVGHSDWLSGLLLFISTTPAAAPDIRPEFYDGISDSWQPLPVQERIDQLPFGHLVAASGYTYQSSGLVTWNLSSYLWTLLAASQTFPQQGVTPPSSYEGFWVRLRNNGTTPLTIDRLLPQLFNTYCTYQDVARFLGIQEFTEEDDPTATYVREQIRAAEDEIDYVTRKAWRPRLQINERHPLNIHGTSLDRRPVWFIVRCVLWNYTSITGLDEGRGQDFFVSQDANQLYFNSIGLGLMPIFGKLTSAYYRQQEPLEVDYVYGADFDTHPRAFMVRDTVLRRVAADICGLADWAPALLGNPELSKPEKIRMYTERADKQMEKLTAFVMV